jgi:type VI secretion system secreted protein VgrG
MCADEIKNTCLSIDHPLKSSKVYIRSFSGHEALSALYHFQLELVSPDLNIKFEDIVGKNVTLGVQHADNKTERIWNGYISRFCQLAGQPRLAIYQAELVPWLWFLTHKADCRIFQDMTVIDIAKEIFRTEGQPNYLDDSKINSGSYRKWEYCVQYRETSCNFITRLLEQEGIYFYFTHQKGSHRMVLADAKSKIAPCQGDPVTYAIRTGSGTKQTSEVVTTWQMQQEVRPGKYTLNDFNFEDSTSTLLNVHSEARHGGDPKLEIYDYPGEYDNHDEGVTLADAYMQAEEFPHTTMSGSGVCRSFAPGFSFKLTGHPRSDQNASYLLVGANHAAYEGGLFSGDASGFTYDNSFLCAPADVPYRPPRVTPKPLMQGSQTATVVGPNREEIYCDKYGRVKVRFHWDRADTRPRGGKDNTVKDEDRSYWIRVSQVWAGSNWGAMHIPRIGQEVIVDFLEGDPDQPIITGRVYNDKNMPPYELPSNMTQSGVKSRSSKDGKSSNFNEIRFEDKKGSEDLLIHAERTMHNSVEASQYITVGGDRHIKTGYIDKEGQEHGDVKELVHDNHNLHVKEEQRTLIEADSSLVVKGDHVEWFNSNLTTKVPTGVCFLGAKEIQISALEKITIQSGASTIQIDPSGITLIGVPLVNINPPGMTVPPLINSDEPTQPDDPD